MFKNRKLEDKNKPKRKFGKLKEKRRNLIYGRGIFYMKGQKQKRKRGDNMIETKNKRIIDIINQLDKENKVIPATDDNVFKALFQSEISKPVLSYIISEVINLNEKYIFDNLVFKNTELIKSKRIEKGKVTDLLVEIKGAIINLEMNKTLPKGTIIKNITYHHKQASEIKVINEQYDSNSKKIIQINFDCTNKFDERLIIKFMLMDEEGKYILDENFENYHINMASIRKRWYTGGEPITRFEKILLMLQLEDKDELRDLVNGDKELENMEKRIEELSYDEDIIGLYDKEAYDKMAHDIDVAEARKEGREEATSESKIEIAKHMLQDKAAIETIMKYTGLTKEEIEGLK